MQTLSPEECVQSGDSSGGYRSPQNGQSGPECLRDVHAKAATGQEIHSDGSRDRCEIHSGSPSPKDYDSWQSPAVRLPDECECCPSVRTPVPAERVEVWVAGPAEYPPPHPGRGCLCPPVRNVRSFVRWLQ